MENVFVLIGFGLLGLGQMMEVAVLHPVLLVGLTVWMLEARCVPRQGKAPVIAAGLNHTSVAVVLLIMSLLSFDAEHDQSVAELEDRAACLPLSLGSEVLRVGVEEVELGRGAGVPLLDSAPPC